MSDTPPIVSGLNARIEQNAQNTAEKRESVQIVDIPKSVETSKQSTRLEGRVTRVNERDRTVTVQTERGEVTLRIPKQQKAPQKGDHVEVRIDQAQSREKQPSVVIKVITPDIDAPPPQPYTPTTKLPPAITADQIIARPADAPPIVILPTPHGQLPDIIVPYIEVEAAQMPSQNLMPSMPPTTIDNVVQNQIAEKAQNLLINNTAKMSQLLATGTLPPTFVNDALQTTAPNITSLPPPADSEHVITMQPIPENNVIVPFKAIAAQLITTHTPLTNSTEIPPLIAEPTEIDVTEISPPQITLKPKSGEPTAPIITDTSKASIFEENSTPRDTKSATLVGYTPDRHFPVLAIHSPPSESENAKQTSQVFHFDFPIIKSTLPIGSEITLRVLNVLPDTETLQSGTATHITTPAPLYPPITTAYLLTPDLWPFMQDIQQSLMNASPQAATSANAAQTIIPNAASPQNLGSAAMFFIAAIRSGDVQSWLGERAVNTLRKAGKGDILSRLGSELNALSRLSREPVSQDWRAFSIPLAWQNEIHKMVIHYRREDRSASEDEQRGGTKTRFVMDLSLSQMGKVQLDALFIGQKENAIGRLDLVLRTEQSFSAAMKQQMREGYKKALQETQITGELSFQGEIDSWVKITQKNAQEFDTDI